jgi:hypothetical protein
MLGEHRRKFNYIYRERERGNETGGRRGRGEAVQELSVSHDVE